MTIPPGGRACRTNVPLHANNTAGIFSARVSHQILLVLCALAELFSNSTAETEILTLVGIGKIKR